MTAWDRINELLGQCLTTRTTYKQLIKREAKGIGLIQVYNSQKNKNPSVNSTLLFGVGGRFLIRALKGGMMNKSIKVGIRHLGIGLAAIVAIRIVLHMVWSDAVALSAVAGVMAAMVMLVARKAYELGKEDGAAEARNRVTEESDGEA